jgi:hypothetical protein
MASSQPGGPKGKAAGASKPAQQEELLSAAAYSANIRSDTQFPPAELYFKVFDSEADEPEARVRKDVNKLYERWQQKYGRRWPENGMNTEDLVWLAEEAYKPALPPGVREPSLAELRAGGVPLEEERYPGEFLPEPPLPPGASAVRLGGSAATGGEGAAGGGKRKGSKGGKGKGGPKDTEAQPPPPQSNYEITAAGGNWVTDEFESGDYEAGNLETLWGMHLWDYESKPTMMPAGPPDEQQVGAALLRSLVSRRALHRLQLGAGLLRVCGVV